ncbi:MAG: homocysteine S-methyltransferase family protein [Phycisphaerae bacterium]|nr:homocysteine S-methyltransferase family protein [Phycisphaerae bacterium]
MVVEIRKVSSVSPLIGGGWIAGELRRRGAIQASVPDVATLSQPQAVQDAYEAFVDAGARWLATNTHHANRAALSRIDAAISVQSINRRAVELCRRAAEPARDRVLVFGEIGPTGLFTAIGELDEARALEVFGEQAVELEVAGANALLLARFADAQEFEWAARACRTATGLPVLACCVFDSGAEREETVCGVGIVDMARTAVVAGVEAFGIDCAAPETALTHVQILSRQSDRPVFARANAGPAEWRDGDAVYPEKPDAFAERMAALREAGAAILGACCGATPAHVAALRRRIEQR